LAEIAKNVGNDNSFYLGTKDTKLEILESDDMNSLSQRLLRMAPGGSNNLALQDWTIFTVFESLEFTWPQQRVLRQGQTQMDPACFCTDRQPDRQPVWSLPF